jgi:FkbM family methyltransferase
MERNVTSKIIKYKDIEAEVREGTSDEFVVREVFSGEYNKLQIKPDDIVIDFGLNIGMFTTFALKKGAALVHGYEPDVDNYNLACKNVEMNISDTSKYVLHNEAVVGNDDMTRDFSINVKKNKGAHSLVAKKGRDVVKVNCTNINYVFETVQPTVVKMDIEGGELECLPAINSWHNVREFIMEFHHAHLNDLKTHEKYNDTLNLLRKEFSLVQAREDTKGAWVNIVYCRKDV